MALAKFKMSAPDFIPLSKKFGAPKKVADIQAWFKAARKVIPQIPDPKNTDWIIYSSEASSDARWITFELQNTVGERCSVVIDRSVSLIG